MREPRPLQ